MRGLGRFRFFDYFKEGKKYSYGLFGHIDLMIVRNFIPTIYFGIFTGMAMMVALLAVLILMPKLILIWKPFK